MAPAERDYLLERAAARIAERSGTLPEDPAARVDSVVIFLNQQGYVSRWEESKEKKGLYLIYVSSCPYYHVSHDHRDVCQIDRYMVQLLAGPGVEVQRLENEAHSGGLCIYALNWPIATQ